MASSVFADSPVSTNDSRMCGESQSDLVVVYGKKGVNVDSNGLDNLLGKMPVEFRYKFGSMVKMGIWGSL